MSGTANHHHALGHAITVYCARCGHSRPLDLAVLVAAGRGDKLLSGLRLVCSAMVASPDGPKVFTCGSRAVRFMVGVDRTGPR